MILCFKRATMEEKRITSQEFDESLSVITQFIGRTLSSKAKEYSSNDDRYHNFRFSQLLIDWSTGHDTTIQHSIWALATKHIVSCLDMLKALITGKKQPRWYIDEKFGDFVNYIILLWVYMQTNGVDEKGENV